MDETFELFRDSNQSFFTTRSFIMREYLVVGCQGKLIQLPYLTWLALTYPNFVGTVVPSLAYILGPNLWTLCVLPTTIIQLG